MELPGLLLHFLCTEDGFLSPAESKSKRTAVPAEKDGPGMRCDCKDWLL